MTRVPDKMYAYARIWVMPNGCWHWTGAIDPMGYGRATRGNEYAVLAHRFVWRFLRGEIGPGMQLDHQCHNTDDACPGGRTCVHRRCVNPEHLEEVTPRQNVTRGKTLPALNLLKTECPYGHPLDWTDPATGWRQCMTCARARHERARRESGAWDRKNSTACRRGHPWSEENTRITSKGFRACRACERIARAARKARR